MVSHKSLLRCVREVMSTHYTCLTFHTLRLVSATKDNDSRDSINRFVLRGRDDTMTIGDAAGGIHHHYYSTAPIQT